MIIREFDLQFFAEEKTEEATPKKKRDARNKGQVVQSKDINQAFALILVVFTIQLTSGWFNDQMQSLYYMINDMIIDTDQYFDPVNLLALLTTSLTTIVLIILPFLLVAMLTGVICSYLQIGFLFTTETLKFKLDKISPLKGFKRLFSMKSVVEMVKAIAKGVILVYISYSYLNTRIELIKSAYALELVEFIALMWSFILGIVLRCAVFLLIVAFLDYAFKKYEQAKDLKMSKKEIKDEYKQSEGDPMLKGKIREKQRMMAMSRMMQDVPEADVVITNPTHYAVAIVYKASEGASPKVVAKGKNLIAQNIKRIAKENQVTIVENKPLARSLFASAEVGDFIPADLYQAVAEVLAYVYSLKK